ncbi:MAG TPA: type II secretion system F family protein, partial [Acidimicrobiales bacterium]|nr:type II secretion system F family protein [Acidimicrobiales bacterium]
IRKIDTSAFPAVKVSALFTGARPDITEVSVRENGKLVPDLQVVPLSQSTTPVGIVLVVDTSGSMKTNGRLDQAKTAAKAFVDRKLANDQIALVTFSNEPRVAVNFTADPGPLVAAIDGLQPAGETALWDGVRTGANLFAERPELLPYLVVLSDGADTVSQSRGPDAFGAARSARTGVFSIAITGSGESDAPALRSLADETGGTFFETRDAAQLGRIYEDLQGVLQNQYELSWTSAVRTPDISLSVKVGSAVADGSAALNSVSQGTAAQPTVVDTPRTPGLLRSSGLYLIALLAGLSAACFGVFVVLFRRDGPALEDVLQAYTGGGAGRAASRAANPGGGDGEGGRTLMPESMRRAVERTAELAGGGGALKTLDTKLDQANLKLSAQEAVLFTTAGLLLAGILGLIAGGPLVALSFLLVAGLVPFALLNQLASRRRKAFTQQLPDTLQLLASSLRAGYSLPQGLDAVAQEVEDPTGRELHRVVLETRLGRDMELALEDLAGRMQSKDFDWVVMAIRIQREVGGNLAELLTNVAETMVSRERLRREISGLTAEGRLSAIIVGALPFLIGGAVAVLNPGYINILFTNSIGRVMVLGATVLMLIGFWWMKKTIEIDV